MYDLSCARQGREEWRCSYLAGDSDWLGREPPRVRYADTFVRVGGEWRLVPKPADSVGDSLREAILGRDKPRRKR